jgi:hypothetical protein
MSNLHKLIAAMLMQLFMNEYLPTTVYLLCILFLSGNRCNATIVVSIRLSSWYIHVFSQVGILNSLKERQERKIRRHSTANNKQQQSKTTMTIILQQITTINIRISSSYTILQLFVHFIIPPF